MNYLADQKGVMHILVAILVVVLVLAAGVAVYNVSQSNKNTTDSTTASSSPSTAATASPTATPVASDQALIIAAVKARESTGGQSPATGSKVILCKLQDGYASVMVTVSSGAGGGDLLLKKSQSSWAVSYEGQNLDDATAAQLGFPQGFANACSSQSPVIYTY